MTDTDMQTIRQRLLAPLLASPDTGVVQGLLDTLTPDGSWPDVDYADQDRAYWKTSTHLRHLLLLARAWRAPVSPLRGDPVLCHATFSAFDFWLAGDFTNPNWWYNQIGVPGTLSQILLLLDPNLSPPQRAKGLEILGRAGLGMTGQNLVWVADITARRALLEDDPDLLQAAFCRIADEIRVTMEEGIQPDFSFHQHGDCLYSHGYGAGFATDCSRIAALLTGTRFAFPQEKVDLLTSLVLDGHQWFARGVYQDFGAIGREIVRSGHTAAFLSPVAAHLLALPTGREPELRALTARLEDDTAPPLIGNRHFWRSAITTHHRPSFYASARMFSDRLVNTDMPCNDEALQSHHIADGATCILRTGREYFDLFPAWDWRKIPGTTTVQSPELSGEVRRQGSRPFVGGVSNGAHGLAAFDFERDGLTARKCWLFLDDAVVCLGSGITCSTEHPVVTTINQCHLRGDAVTPSGPLAQGFHFYAELPWIHHDDIAYFFPAPTTVYCENQSHTGSWQEISRSASPELVERDVFTLWTDHGASPWNATYAYIVAPNLPLSAVQQGTTPAVDILANRPNLQAARHTEQQVTGIAFYQPGSLEIEPGWTVAVDQPCLLLLHCQGSDLSISASNPENEGLGVIVESSRELEGEGVAEKEGKSWVSLSLPGDMDAGKSVTRRLRFG